MKKKIIIIALIVVIGGAGITYSAYSSYRRTNYASGMSEAADRLGNAVDKYVSSRDDTAAKLYGADTTKQKGILRAQAEQHGIKLKDLSDRQLEKLKKKNEKLIEETYYIGEKLNNTEIGTKEHDKLFDKYCKLVEKQNEYQCQIDYNEIGR
jgi:hypothetical protein